MNKLILSALTIGLLSCPFFFLAEAGFRQVQYRFLAGNNWMGDHYRTSCKITRWIRKDAKGHPFNLVLSDSKNDGKAHLIYMLTWRGANYQHVSPKSMHDFGVAPLIYLVVRPSDIERVRTAISFPKGKDWIVKWTGGAAIVRARFPRGEDGVQFIEFLRTQKNFSLR
jgi:hypothetical protein